MAQVKDTDDTTANNILDTLLYNAKYDDNPYSYNVFALFGQEVDKHIRMWTKEFPIA